MYRIPMQTLIGILSFRFSISSSNLYWMIYINRGETWGFNLNKLAHIKGTLQVNREYVWRHLYLFLYKYIMGELRSLQIDILPHSHFFFKLDFLPRYFRLLSLLIFFQTALILNGIWFYFLFTFFPHYILAHRLWYSSPQE